MLRIAFGIPRVTMVEWYVGRRDVKTEGAAVSMLESWMFMEDANHHFTRTRLTSAYINLVEVLMPEAKWRNCPPWHVRSDLSETKYIGMLQRLNPGKVMIPSYQPTAWMCNGPG